MHHKAKIPFRIVQEALNNIGNHSKATDASIALDFAANNFKVTVQDNGQGFIMPKKISDFASGGKLGIERMTQRAKLLDGELTIHSEPGKGTTVTLQTSL